MPHLLHIVAIVFEPSVHGCNPSLAARIIVTDKILAVFIDGIVGEVHVYITLLGWREVMGEVGSGEVLCVEWGSGKWGKCRAGEWEVGK